MTRIYVHEQAISKEGTYWDLSGNTKFSGSLNIHGFYFDLSATTVGDSLVFDGISYKPSKAASSFSGGTVTGATIFSGGLSANTIFSGGTDLNNIFQRIGTDVDPITKYDKSGGTISGNVIVTGNTNVQGNLTGSTLFSGSTNLNDIFERISDFNIYTGNTFNSITAITSNISNLQSVKADLSGSTFIGNIIAPSISGNSVSATTIYGNIILSGSSDLNEIFQKISDFNVYSASTNSSITGNTANINLKYDKSGGTITGNVIVTGNTSVQSFTATTISSGSTDLNNIFLRISNYTVLSADSVTEINTGTDNIKYVTSSGLTGSKYLDQSQSKIYSVASGTNTYTATTTPAITLLSSGLTINILFSNGSTDTCTLDIGDGSGSKNMWKDANTVIGAYDVKAGVIYTFTYDGTQWQGDIGEVLQSQFYSQAFVAVNKFHNMLSFY